MPIHHVARLRPLLAAIAAASLFAAQPSQAAMLTRESAGAELQTMPLFKVLAEHYAATYDKMLTMMVEGVNNGRRLQDVTAELNPIYVGLVGEQLPKANIENSQAMLRLVIEQGKAAGAIDPQLCLSLLGLAKPAKPLATQLPAELVAKEQAISARLLEQTALAPEAPTAAMTDALLEKIAFEAYDAMPGDQLRAAMRGIDGDPKKAVTPLQQTAYCEFSIAMLETIEEMRPIEGSRAFKGLMAYK